MPYRLTQAAQEDIINISEVGITLFDERQACTYHDALFDMFDLLAVNPMMARERTEFTTPFRIHRFQSHMIVYQIEDNGILIIRVRHGREDWISDPA